MAESTSGQNHALPSKKWSQRSSLVLLLKQLPGLPMLPVSGRSESSSTVTSAMARRTPSPARSPRMLVQTVSPLSLPPCPVPSTDSTSSIPPATARAEVSSAASSCTSSAPLAPVTSASASAGVSSAAPSVAGPSAQPAPDTLPLAEDVETAPGSEPCWLPTKLIKTVPAQVQKWISAALWKHWRLRTDLKLWYDPPEPALIYHQAPDPEHFFAHRLLLWVPNHLWKVRLTCPVGGKQYAWVIGFLRERALGNSPTRLVRQLRENHSEEWLKRLCRYLGARSDFAARPSLLPVKFHEPREPVDIPSHRWMLAV
ncbi:uncharacterized protein LOC111660930 [Seriola lalandi dorsalis]|uniref:uncharacterized protein LOC111660930 n=1 Tax=Seriola lalandi dorsalis TaxID=1841481 RepID=UPI000C6FA8AD|nr:uncharacterized protein LOC111660930 [Seriola lalandi dorsalis]